MQTQTECGYRKKTFEFICRGVLGPKAMWEFAHRLIRFAGMTPARKGRIDRYPFNGGGGKGFTIYQPLTESLLAVDVYTKLNETWILLATCKPERISRGALKAFLSKEIGPIISGEGE